MMRDLVEKVVAANQQAWDEFPEPITHENLGEVRLIAARAVIAVCAEEMAKVAEERFTPENVNKTKAGEPTSHAQAAIWAAGRVAAAIRSMKGDQQ